MGRYTLALVVLALLCASAAKSDSWGYFCETDGLLVYDLDHQSEPWQRLHLVRFGPGQQAFQQDVIAGPDAQIHAIRCESDSISILGGNRGWWEIRYAISEGGKLALTSRESIDEARRQELMQPQTPNLGFLARASLDHKVFPSEQIELHSADPEHAYALSILASDDQSVEAECKPRMVKSVVQRIAKSGKVVESLTVFDRSQAGECLFGS